MTQFKPLRAFSVCLLLLMMLLLPVSSLRAEEKLAGFHEQAYDKSEYKGDFANHENFKKYEEELCRALNDFPALYKKVTGQEIGDYKGIRVIVKDKLHLEKENFTIGGVTIYEGKGVSVHLNVLKDIGLPGQVYQLVLHEMVHAVQRRDVNNSDSWESWPVWFREALAVYISGEVAEKIYTIGTLKLIDGIDPMTTFVGIEKPEDENYAEWGLMLEFLDAKVKPGKLGELIRANYEKNDLQANLKKIYDLEWEDFRTQGRKYAEERFLSRFPEKGVKAYIDAMKEKDAMMKDPNLRGNRAKVLEAAKKLRENFQDIANNKDWEKTPIPVTARWEIAILQALEGNIDDGIKTLRSIIEKEPNHPQRPNVLFNVPGLQKMKGDFKTALEGYEYFLNMCPKHEKSAAAKKYMEECKAKLGDGGGDKDPNTQPGTGEAKTKS